MRLRILPYNRLSKSARELSLALGVKRIRLEGSKFKPNEGTVILNWGNTKPPFNMGMNVLNKPESVRLASNKREFFNLMEEDDVVVWTTSREEAQSWIEKGSVVVGRQKLSGHSGEGIELYTEQVSPAPLYTKYVKKQEEYRVHVFMGQVIDVQNKMRKLEVPDEEVNWKIRNHQNGFIFGRDGVALCDSAKQLAIRCVVRCNLDFGAVDLIYNAKRDKYYALEVNTAPGLEGTTLTNYVNKIQEVVGRWMI